MKKSQKQRKMAHVAMGNEMVQNALRGKKCSKAYALAHIVLYPKA